MIKIIKTSAKQWQGNGFGTSAATWGIENHPEIRINRASGLWVAVGDGVGRVASETRQGLEQRIINRLAA
jgi:hypothetical protein